MKKLFLFTLLLALPLLASAYDIVVENDDGVKIYYQELYGGLELEVTYLSATNANSQAYRGNVVIPEEITYDNKTRKVTSIGDYAFSWCTGMISISIPTSVIHIGNHAFFKCYGLTSLSIPNSVKTIDTEAFSNCTNLISLTIPNSLVSVGDAAFSDLTYLTSINIPDNWTSIGENMFEGCRNLTSVVIPSSVTSIGNFAFNNCSGLTSVTIGENVKSIGEAAFGSCIRLTSITIPNSVTSIGTSVFEYCSALKSISLSNSLLSIGKNAFFKCTSLTSITFPNSLISIGDWAFQDCFSLSSVISLVERPFNINGWYSDYRVFDKKTFDTATLYVPVGTIEKYKNTSGWCDFKLMEEGNPFEHTLTYLVDGETYSIYTLEEGDAITPEEAPIKEGYSFSGWSEIPETMPASDLTITGTFVPNKYKLTYFVDGGEYKTSEIEFGSAITAEDNPTKEGYTFSGWNEIPETMPANDVTITGSFTVNKYNLIYKVDGVDYKTTQIEYGSAITPEAIPTKEGYTFSGWSEIPETMLANDVTVTGTFAANKYKLTYMVDGEEYKASEVDYGTAITAEAVPTKEGYTFSGWSEIPSTMPAEDVTVTGTFTVNKYTITYMVDDEILTTEEVAYGSTIAPPKSQKDGYDILWSFYPTTMPAYSITINGTYTTGINSPSMEEKDRQVFTPDGKRLETPKKGLNIIRMSDGTVKKVVVK